jgi:hypothetical protein
MLTEGKGALPAIFFSTSGAHQATQPDCTDPRVYQFRRKKRMKEDSIREGDFSAISFLILR